MNPPWNNYYIKRHEAILGKIINDIEIPAKYIRQALEYALFSGGKRLRPTLVYLVGEILKVDTKILDYLAASVECLHCYSLIHDDLPAMDNDDWRRGKPSCHRAFDEATAILAGDGLHALAIEILLDRLPKYLTLDKIQRIVLELLKASGLSGMVSGQSLDLSELTSTVDLETLCQIHYLKTGKLILACINMVILASNNKDTVIEQRLQEYGRCLGLAFQIQDDYLDCYRCNTLGKHRSADESNQKFTFARLYNQSKHKALINNYYNQSLNALLSLNLMTQSLVALTTKLKERSLF